MSQYYIQHTLIVNRHLRAAPRGSRLRDEQEDVHQSCENCDKVLFTVDLIE